MIFYPLLVSTLVLGFNMRPGEGGVVRQSETAGTLSLVQPTAVSCSNTAPPSAF